MSVSRETSRMATYADLLRKWNPRINLIGPQTADDLERRHLEDCKQLALLAPESGTWMDMGSGGGLPGLVIAIYRPCLTLTLVESDQRKAVFLRTVVRELELLNTRVISQRIENIESASAQNISARALAPLDRLMAYSYKHLLFSGACWFMKGKTWKIEVDRARESWDFDLQVFPSVTDNQAAILKVTRLRHVV